MLCQLLQLPPELFGRHSKDARVLRSEVFADIMVVGDDEHVGFGVWCLVFSVCCFQFAVFRLLFAVLAKVVKMLLLTVVAIKSHMSWKRHCEGAFAAVAICHYFFKFSYANLSCLYFDQ